MKKIFFFLQILLLKFPVHAQNKPVPKKTNSDSVKITITNPGKTINSTFSDYAPVISADGEMIVFTSRRPVTEKEIQKMKEGMGNVYASYFDVKKEK